MVTTASIMQWLSALIPDYPEIQRRAQEELVWLPTIEDEKDLPFCHAIIEEVERMRNPFWLGTPHVASEDFVYKGQFIPKDTVCVLNTYSMHYNPERHADPHTFNVSRCLSSTD